MVKKGRPVHRRVSTMDEFQQGKNQEDTSWRSDSWMAGMLLWGVGSQDPGPIMNLPGSGRFPVSSLAGA